jgi:hypothetical protein
MSWVINIDFQDGGGTHDISSLVLIDTIRRTRTLYNKNLQPTVDSLKFKMHRNTSYINSLLTNDDETLITVTKDGSDYFTGTIRPNFKLQVGAIVGQVQIECVGYADKLKKKINSTFAYGSYKVSDATTKAASVIHQLLVLAGFNVDDDISIATIDKTIDYFVNIGGKDSRTYWDVITKLLFEFGYVWYFDESGVFRIHDFLPTDTSTSDAFDNTNMRGKLTIQRKLEDFKGVTVTWYPHETEEDAVVFSDTTGGSAASKCDIELAADGYYPDGVDTANVYSEYEFDGHDVIIVNNAALDEIVESGIDTSFTSYYRRALVSFHNSTGGALSITKFDITGDVVYQGDQQKTSCILEAGSEDIKDLDSEYLTTMADADKLAIGLARHYKYSDFIYTVYSETDYSLGGFVDVEDNMLGIDNRCVVVKIEDIDQTQDLKKYTLYGIEDYSAETTTLEAEKSGPPPAAPGTNVTEADIATRPTYTEVVNGFTDATSGGTTVPTTPTISVCKGVFRGIVLAWDKQETLTNFSRYEVQVSSDDSTWYSLEFDGSDWKASEGADTDWLTEFLVHSAIPLDVSGGTDDPAGVTLYYRVRRVTKASVTSDWSTSASATTSHLDTGDYGANSISANALNVSELSAIVADLGTVTAGTIDTDVSISVGALPSLSDEGLEAYWSFDDGFSGSADGATLTDNSGNGHNATADGCTWTAGVSGRAVDFDGTDDYVSHDSITYASSDPWTHSAWLYWDGDETAPLRFYAGDSSRNYKNIGVRYFSNNNFFFRNASGTFTSFGSNSAIDETWSLVTWVADGTGNLSLYVSGAFVVTHDVTDTAITFNAIGRGYSNSSYNFGGYIDEPRIYSRALSANEVKYLYLNPGGTSGRTVISGDSITTGVISAVDINLNDVFVVSGTTGIITYNADAVELGSGADASGTHSVAIGKDAGGDGTASSGDYSVAIGDGANYATAIRSVAIGYSATATGNWSVAVGYSADAEGLSSTAIGYNSKAEGNNGVAVGSGAWAQVGSATAVGGGADARSLNSVAIGYDTDASATSAVAIGYSAAANATAQFDLNTNDLNLTAFYFASGTTQNDIYDALYAKMSPSGAKSWGIIGYQDSGQLCRMYWNGSNAFGFYNVNNSSEFTATNGSGTTMSGELKFLVIY